MRDIFNSILSFARESFPQFAFFGLFTVCLLFLVLAILILLRG